MAVSLDGKIASHPDESDAARHQSGFVNADDREFVQQQINESDAVILGANTMRASGGIWEQLGRNGKMPVWVVIARHELDGKMKFWQQNSAPRWVVSPQAAIMHNPQVQNFAYGADHPAEFVVRKLKELPDIKRVLLFGGGQINQLFYERHLVNELKMTLCPVIVGSSAAPMFVNPPLSGGVRLLPISSHVKSSHVFLHYTVNSSSHA